MNIFAARRKIRLRRNLHCVMFKVPFISCFVFLSFLELISANASAESWTIRGHVIPMTKQREGGHYEVGLYAAVGADGLPTSYPLLQEILPQGRLHFSLRIPRAIGRGFLFAEFVDSESSTRSWVVPTENPWTPQSMQPAELYLRVRPRSRILEEDTITLSGFVEAFHSGSEPSQSLPDVEVKIRGRGESVRTNAQGKFSFRLPKFRGRIALEVLKPGFYPSVVSVKATDAGPVKITLANRSQVARIARSLGLVQREGLGVFLGRASRENGFPLAGFSARLPHRADGPFYFSELGQAERNLRATTGDGRFLFLNLSPGPAFLEGDWMGEGVSPLRISPLEGGEFLEKNLVPVLGFLSGRILNAVSSGGPEPISGARVRVEGAPDWTSSDFLGSFRFGPLRWFRGERISLMFSAGNFYNHRYQIDPQLDDPALKLYAFPSGYLERLASSLGEDFEDGSGWVIGRARGAALRIETVPDRVTGQVTKDFYFDARGRARPRPAATEPRFGTYFLMNVPAGHSYLMGSDTNGSFRYGRDVFAGPGVVNVEVDSDKAP